jgi:hypothetical protein
VGTSHGLGEQKRSTRRINISYAHRQLLPRASLLKPGDYHGRQIRPSNKSCSSSIPIIEHAQIDIHAVHLRELIWPTTNDRGVTCFARDAVRTTRRKNTIQESFLKHAMQSKTHAISNLCISDFAKSAGHIFNIQTDPCVLESLGECPSKLARVSLRLLRD